MPTPCLRQADQDPCPVITARRVLAAVRIIAVESSGVERVVERMA